jgi:hypothetical protein
MFSVALISFLDSVLIFYTDNPALDSSRGYSIPILLPRPTQTKTLYRAMTFLVCTRQQVFLTQPAHTTLSMLLL